MAEITASRIESIADSGTNPRDQPSHDSHPNAAVVAKLDVAPDPPEIGAPEEDEKHALDEMA